MAKSINNGNWSRIGDNAFGLGLTRYRDHDDRPLWRFYVTRQPSDKAVEIDASMADLNAIKRWCEQAIRTLADDGGRVSDEPTSAALPSADGGIPRG